MDLEKNGPVVKGLMDISLDVETRAAKMRINISSANDKIDRNSEKSFFKLSLKNLRCQKYAVFEIHALTQVSLVAHACNPVFQCGSRHTNVKNQYTIFLLADSYKKVTKKLRVKL